MQFDWLNNNTEQILLFDKSPFISELNLQFKVPEDFYKNGFTRITNIETLEKAAQVAHAFINSIDTNKIPLLKSFLPRIKLSKSNPIPVCEPCVQSSYVALHYDMGLPIISEKPQLLQVFIGLWLPKDAPDATTITRLVNIKQLCNQKSFGTKEQVNQRLINYAKQFGDGWTKPTKHNTQRLACFGSIIDAVTNKHQLTDWTEYLMDEWFQVKDDPDGKKSMQFEYEFYNQCGLDIKQAEQRIKLNRGDLLIFDNLRVVHGRVGKRPKAEIHQFMFGLKEVTPKEIDQVRHDLVLKLSNHLFKETKGLCPKTAQEAVPSVVNKNH